MCGVRLARHNTNKYQSTAHNDSNGTTTIPPFFIQSVSSRRHTRRTPRRTDTDTARDIISARLRMRALNNILNASLKTQNDVGATSRCVSMPTTTTTTTTPGVTTTTTCFSSVCARSRRRHYIVLYSSRLPECRAV